MLDRRDDLAVLWDLRVHPDHQRSGVGSALLDRAVEWSRAEGMTQLKIETQDTNVAACRFYAARGARRRAAGHRPPRIRQRGRAIASEVQLHWWIDLCT